MKLQTHRTRIKQKVSLHQGISFHIRGCADPDATIVPVAGLSTPAAHPRPTNTSYPIRPFRSEGLGASYPDSRLARPSRRHIGACAQRTAWKTGVPPNSGRETLPAPVEGSFGSVVVRVVVGKGKRWRVSTADHRPRFPQRPIIVEGCARSVRAACAIGSRIPPPRAWFLAPFSMAAGWRETGKPRGIHTLWALERWWWMK